MDQSAITELSDGGAKTVKPLDTLPQKRSKRLTPKDGNDMPPEVIYQVIQEMCNLLSAQGQSVIVSNVYLPDGLGNPGKPIASIAFPDAVVSGAGMLTPRNAGNAGKGGEK